MNELTQALQMRDWYLVAGLVLTLLVQVTRKSPAVRNLWQAVPDGWRWIMPMGAGAVAGFLAAFQSGADLTGALLSAVGGALGIGVPAMGGHALLKESPVRWDGKAGGK